MKRAEAPPISMSAFARTGFESVSQIAARRSARIASATYKMIDPTFASYFVGVRMASTGNSASAQK